MIARMIRYMCDSGESYRIVQIPEICCWTEGPSNLKILSRQRTRWGRGLLQMFQVHRDMVFNPAYRQYGLFTLPYIMVFELFAPLIEFTGYLMILWLFLIQAINYHTIWIVFLSLYCFAQFLSLTIISIDSFVAHGFKKQRDYLWLFLASLLEPFLYHPLNVFFSLRGYWKHIWGRRMVWGAMTRKGFQPAEASVTNGGEAGEAAEEASVEKEINA